MLAEFDAVPEGETIVEKRENWREFCLRTGQPRPDGMVVEEHIYHMAGADTEQEMSVEALVEMIRSAGRVPVERDALYETVREYDA